MVGALALLNMAFDRPIKTIDDLDEAIGTVMLMEDKVVNRAIAYTIMSSMSICGGR